MTEFKFKKIQEMVLFNIARARKNLSVSEIKILTGGSLNEKQITNSISSLKKRGLISKDKNKYGLNIKKFNVKKFDSKSGEYIKVNKIKEILGEHWENNWEVEWNAIKA